ncbi:MAG TPA: cysteine desulfurase [Syntrophobacteraceae bacterium]|nr:cysteine desulfurase [Syntrophobacteraceae bacterium]
MGRQTMLDSDMPSVREDLAKQKGCDTDRIRSDFPILQRVIDGRQITYFDTAATSLKPQPVIDAIMNFYTRSTANIHRGVHLLSMEASDLYEEARGKVARFLNADEEEIVFVRNATEAINLVCNCLPLSGHVVVTVADHHSVLLPWYGRRKVSYVGVKRDGLLELADMENAVSDKPALVCLPHVSNALGAVTPVEECIAMTHKAGGLILVDGSQSVPHMLVDVQALGCDFLAFSGHKMLGPSGIGVLYGRRELLERMQPFMRGGSMIKEVRKDYFLPEDLPGKFEAGTPNIEGAIGLGAAVEYLESIGMDNVEAHVRKLTAAALDVLSHTDKIRVHGPKDPKDRSASVAFTLPGLEAHGLAKILSNRYAIMVRSGYHCAQLLHETLGIGQTVRASFYIYNTLDEIHSFGNALAEIVKSYTHK